MNESLHDIVRRAETNYESGNTKIGQYVDFSMKETVETITAYLHSKHVSGKFDSLGREKPFFNIVQAAVNIWYRATDLDRKDVVVLPSSSKTVLPAFMATIYLQEWMKKNHFGLFLNQWGRTLAQYGSAVTKFLDREGELIPSVVPWNRFLCDPVDFEALPRIEKIYKTPAQLLNMATKGHPDYAGYDYEKAKSLIDAVQSREDLQGEQVDNQAEFIELYEVHGEMSQAVYNSGKGKDSKDGDNEVFYQQMHVISWCEDKDGKNMDFTLYCGLEKKDPYMITHLIEEDGRTLSIGAVEYLFDAQWMANHSMKSWKDQMDLYSRLILQTADGNLVGKNVLTNIETGQIIKHAPNMPLSAVPNTGHDIASIQSHLAQWRSLGQEVSSTPEAARGVTPPSGTPYSSVALVTSQGLSLFEIMTENKGLYLEKMLRLHVIPHLKTKMNNTDDLVAHLDDKDVKKLDSMYVPKEAVRQYKKRVISSLVRGEVPDPTFNRQAEEGAVQEQLQQFGNLRSISPDKMKWSEIVKDLEWKLDVGITNEQHDKQTILTTLSTVLQTIATNPLILQDPNAKMLFGKILSETGVVSPLEISATQAPVPSPVQPGAEALSALTNNKQ